jgi:DNA-binding MarR family transcriptional regulator
MHIHIIILELLEEYIMETEYCYNLAMRKATRLINQLYQERFTTLGLKVGQFSIIRAVHHLKETTNSQLQGVLVLDQTTLSRNLKPLVRDGILQLRADANDQRVKKVSLSAEGQALYQQALPLWQAAQAEFKAKLGEQKAKQLLSLSDSVINATTSI